MKKDDFLDGFSKLAGDALSSAAGAKDDIHNFIKSKVEHITNDLELVKKEEFEALKLMVVAQGQEIKALKQALENSKDSENS